MSARKLPWRCPGCVFCTESRLKIYTVVLAFGGFRGLWAVLENFANVDAHRHPAGFCDQLFYSL
jgi:hypothetical protein